MSEESLRPQPRREAWEFAGWGSATRIVDLAQLELQTVSVSHLDTKHRHVLGAWSATAICGNDITSSCLYVSALCAAQAGPYAPLALVAVGVLLYLFRRIYAEVGSALPLNGGTYTVLLNTTNKRFAAGAACLTLLSYITTAVISAGEAMHYAHNLWHGVNVFGATIVLLGFFAFLNLIGISESALVAVLIFVLHMLTLVVLTVAGVSALLRDPTLLIENWSMRPEGGVIEPLFFGFCAAMLGISGFESSANFIEEQKPGVFPKTLRNMWLAVMIFNPLISLISLALLPLATIREIPPDMLAEMGELSAGRWLRELVSVDAVLVLCGAVLTSYVGVTGLVQRMTLDRCLPAVLLRTNRLRGTNHWIIIGFFLVCCSILIATEGNVGSLAAVYTLSFLSVMALFAVGNMALKVKRARLPRETRASWVTVCFALLAVMLGLAGNVFLNQDQVRLFAIYFACASAIVGTMLLRVPLLRGVLYVSGVVVDHALAFNRHLSKTLGAKITQINDRPVVYFTRGDAPEQLLRAVQYVLQNEQTARLIVVHVHASKAPIPDKLAEQLSEIDRRYPALRIDFIAVEGQFGPELIQRLSERLEVPKNYMFIGTPSDRFPHRVEDLGGVRLVL